MIMDKTKLREIRAKLDTILAEFGEENGINVKLGNATYSDSNATFKLEVADINEDGEALTKEATNFKIYASRNHLTAEDFGATFCSRGKTFEICGLNTRAHKMPILAKCKEDGKTYKFDGLSVARNLGR
jgi:hypothetical protein